MARAKTTRKRAARKTAASDNTTREQLKRAAVEATERPICGFMLLGHPYECYLEPGHEGEQHETQVEGERIRFNQAGISPA